MNIFLNNFITKCYNLGHSTLIKAAIFVRICDTGFLIPISEKKLTDNTFSHFCANNKNNFFFTSWICRLTREQVVHLSIIPLCIIIIPYHLKNKDWRDGISAEPVKWINRGRKSMHEKANLKLFFIFLILTKGRKDYTIKKETFLNIYTKCLKLNILFNLHIYSRTNPLYLLSLMYAIYYPKRCLSELFFRLF